MELNYSEDLSRFLDFLRHCSSESLSALNTEAADVVEVVHGEWIAVPSSDMATGKAYKCSVCKSMRYGVRLPSYYQKCGAKMTERNNI